MVVPLKHATMTRPLLDRTGGALVVIVEFGPSRSARGQHRKHRLMKPDVGRHQLPALELGSLARIVRELPAPFAHDDHRGRHIPGPEPALPESIRAPYANLRDGERGGPGAPHGQNTGAGNRRAQAGDDELLGAAVHLGDEIDPPLVLDLLLFAEVFLEEDAGFAGHRDGAVELALEGHSGVEVPRAPAAGSLASSGTGSAS